ncbi:MAG: 2-C-methyl-D-erythritol 4-phosphate cytidylyltransferase [candidate division WOR-3 bacterium]|nr:2-C-methyl-D-erythritol 4-phosphate cytidylyltransferase [candidate division WOR-3 bacterium]
MNFGLIVAAGKGNRFQGTKQFFLLGGKPLVLHALETFSRSSYIDQIVVVTNAHKIKYLETLADLNQIKKIRAVVSGGEHRQDSVWQGLRILPDKANSYIAIHDGVRPLIDNKLLVQGFTLCRKYKAVIYGIPVNDTIKEAKHGRIIRTFDRTNLYLIQTPQFYQLNLIKRAYQQAVKNNFYATDDAALVERLGFKVHIFLGSKSNIKITNREDLKLVQKLIQAK